MGYAIPSDHHGGMPRTAAPLDLEQADALRRGLPLPSDRAYPANASTDEIRARLIALTRGSSALLEEDGDLSPETLVAVSHHLREALRILFVLRVDQRPQEDVAGPFPFERVMPFGGSGRPA